MKQAITARKGAPAPSPQPPPVPVPEVPASWGTRSLRLLILAAGVVATHMLLFAPSLLGRKILLPLDRLTAPHVYLPPEPEYKDVHFLNRALSDPVDQFELQRRFAASEIRAGRVPLWNPYIFCGAPFVFCTYSPFMIPYYLYPHPISGAWSHVLSALVGAGGAYVFFRRVLGVGFWPAVVVSWCFPLAGFFQLWLNFYLSYTFPFFPWLLVAVDATVRRPGGWGGPTLAVVTGLTLLSGAPDVAGQALLACGLFALWRLGERYYRERDRRTLFAGVGALSAGWLLGILLAAIWLVPLFDYIPTGIRIQNRAKASEERPPTGIWALPQMFLPLFFGSTFRDWPFLLIGNLQECGSQAYAGLSAAFILAPLGFARRRFRSLNTFWVLIGVLSAAWFLNLWPLTDVLRLPVLNLMSHNRFLFVFAFATLAVAALGLDAIARGEVRWHTGYVVPVLLLVALGFWTLERAADVRDIVKEDGLHDPATKGRKADIEAGLVVARANLQRTNLIYAAMCAGGVGLWWVVIKTPRRVAFTLVSCALLAELLWFDKDQNPQSDPALYYPPVPALTELSQKPPGRIIGLDCLPPLIPMTYGFRDLRGYDAVDPARIVGLLSQVRDHQVQGHPVPYAMTQWYVPGFLKGTDGSPRVVPSLSMLNLRYVIFRGPTYKEFSRIIEGNDYWVYENREALPRVYVPARVAVLPDKEVVERIAGRQVIDIPGKKLVAFAQSAVDFEPAKIAYVPTDPGLPGGECRGTAEIVYEDPGEIRVAVDMKTPGLLVLADQFYDGWHAYVNDRQYPVLPVNYVIRGVPLPAGRGELVFRYEPAGWTRGVRLAGFAAVAVVCWAAALSWLGWHRRAASAVV